MKFWNLVTFADKANSVKQKYLNDYAESLGLVTHPYTQPWLKKQSFYKNNKEILSSKTGAGYWLWKPYIIANLMDKLNDGELIVYSDVGDMFHPELFPYVEDLMGPDDPCLLLIGGFPQKLLTKRDCFVYMDCDEEDYWECTQLEGGMQFWRNTPEARKVVSEWLEACTDRRILTDDENVSGKENFDGFRGHFHDQAVLTNLACKYGLSAVPQQDQIRHYLECNVDYWYERNEESGFNMGRPIESLLLQLKEDSPHVA